MLTDDGVGRSKAEEIKSKSVEKSKSMGLQITADRLAMLTWTVSNLHFLIWKILLMKRESPLAQE